MVTLFIKRCVYLIILDIQGQVICSTLGGLHGGWGHIGRISVEQHLEIRGHKMTQRFLRVLLFLLVCLFLVFEIGSHSVALVDLRTYHIDKAGFGSQ